jgi:hypothetical protein
VVGHWYAAGREHLGLVHSGRDDRGGADEAGFPCHGIFEVAESAAFAQAGSVGRHRYAAGDDQVDGFQVVDVHGLAVA